MSAALRFLESGDVRWDPVVMGMGHDVYHLRGYATTCEAQQADPVVLAVAELDGHAVAAPFIVRPVPESLPGAAGLRDAVAPYGYPALICTSENLRVQAKLLRSLVESMRSQGLVSAFVRCNPFVGLDRSVLREQAEVVRHGELVVVDMGSLPDAAEESFRLNHRRDIRQLREAGFRVRIDHPADRASFPGLYRDRMRAVNANPYYLFPDSYFDALFKALGEHARLVAVLDASNELAAAVILFVSGTLAHYHLGASPEEFLKAAPMKLAVLGMICLLYTSPSPRD